MSRDLQLESSKVSICPSQRRFDAAHTLFRIRMSSIALDTGVSAHDQQQGC